MRRSYLYYFVLINVFLLSTLYAQTVTKRQLAEELKKCDLALKASQEQIKVLSMALRATDSLMLAHRAATDRLIQNLHDRLVVQDSITTLMQVNADTLQAMVRDYKSKLEEVDRLYIAELKKQTKPWFLTGNGLKGLVYGVFIGGALGLTFAILK
ncbi:MAG TPA: hypothetical protein EYP36_10550 [Calditrichaeota bacterium]|nr:hypothetical protein [Calditrichota bacterium]